MRPPLSYRTAAEVLLGLASQDGVVLNGTKDDPIRRLLYVGAEACQRIDQAQADREAALLYVAELRALLERAVGILDAQPLPLDGGTWDSCMLAYQARVLLRSEPLTAGRALRDELHATSAVADAATALVAAWHEGDPARTRLCQWAFEQAVAWLKAMPRKATGPFPPRAADGESRG
jgi:hypothetical protein